MRAARRRGRRLARGASRRARRGFTLVELGVVLAVLSLLAGAVVVSSASSESELLLDAAAGEVAAALRHARAEALRSGEARHVEFVVASDRIVVGKPDLTLDPVVTEYVLVHPLHKRPFDFVVGQTPGAEGVELASADFVYAGLGGQSQSVIFDPEGTPVFVGGGRRHTLSKGAVRLSHGGAQRHVRVSHLGQVRIQ